MHFSISLLIVYIFATSVVKRQSGTGFKYKCLVNIIGANWFCWISVHLVFCFFYVGILMSLN